VGAPYLHELRVRYGECDPQGIVFNANYLLYYDVAFTELWREAIGPWSVMNERGVDVVVAEASLRFLAPARYDDVVGLSIAVEHLGATSIVTGWQARREDEVLVEGGMRHVCVDAATWRKTELPDWLRAGLEPLVSSGGAADAAPAGGGTPPGPAPR
jgi:acyl-CoA thioester hydrolase